MGTVLLVGERYGKVCWGLGKIRGDEKSVEGVEKYWVRRGEVCWGVGKVREETGGGGCEEVLGRGVRKCVGVWGK